MKGTALVNAVQTTMFLLVGTVAFLVIGYGMGGFSHAIGEMLGDLLAGGAADTRACVAALLLQLHVHSVFGDRLFRTSASSA